jgi:hypothetical protein
MWRAGTRKLIEIIKIPTLYFLGHLPLRRLLSKYFGALNYSASNYITFSEHAFITENIFCNNLPISKIKKFSPNVKIGILIQGPITKYYTVRTIEHYFWLYPEINIVLSTWDDENMSEISKLEDKAKEHNWNFNILKNSKPVIPGLSNINLQIVSTNNGLGLLESLKVSHILKTRTDQCAFSLNFLELLNEKYSTLEESGHFDRIIGLSMGTFLWRPFGLSDMFIFGSTSNVKEYFNVPLDLRTSEDLPFETPNSFREEFENCQCEIYFMTNYVEKKGFIARNTLESSFAAYREFMFVIDFEILELVWFKYGYNDRKNPELRYLRMSNFIWNLIYQNKFHFNPANIDM